MEFRDTPDEHALSKVDLRLAVTAMHLWRLTGGTSSRRGGWVCPGLDTYVLKSMIRS
jgi:hypothetical protein